MECYHSSFTIQVPRVDLFSEQAQLHGAIIVQLKTKWPCAEHQGKNGGGGHCYIAHNGDHVGLNNHRFKIWASAIVSYVLYNLLLKSDLSNRQLMMPQNTSRQILLNLRVFVMVA
jgi:hypothetical protein